MNRKGVNFKGIDVELGTKLLVTLPEHHTWYNHYPSQFTAEVIDMMDDIDDSGEFVISVRNLDDIFTGGGYIAISNLDPYWAAEVEAIQ